MGFLKWLIKSRIRLILIVILIGAGYFGYQTFGVKTQAPQYQTAQVEKGTLVTSISASGTVTSASRVSLATQATGVVKEVLVKNGDKVVQGQKIAEITLDLSSQAKQAAAWSSYLQSKNSLDSAQAKINSLQSALFAANQELINDAVARDLKSDDPTYIQQNADWLQAEADYKNQEAVITQSQAALSGSWLSYLQISSVINAPITGTVSGLSISPGLTIASQTSSSTTTINSTTLGTITMENAKTQSAVNLTEIDVVNVKEGQKVTMTMDAFPDKSFTGKVVTINTNGSVSSGVTTYPTTITFDTSLDNIYPNMAISAKIITDVRNDALLVPSAAVQTANGESSVRVMKNNQITTVLIEIGKSNDTQTEIVSGLSEGEMVVTGSTTISGNRTQTGTSPFSVGDGRGFGGGGVRINR